LAGYSRVGRHRDRYTEPFFQGTQMCAFVVEHIERDLSARAHDQIVRCALDQHLLDSA
jgi:hypothetical protein